MRLLRGQTMVRSMSVGLTGRRHRIARGGARGRAEQTCYCTQGTGQSEARVLFTLIDSAMHTMEGHPESPARMRAIVDALQSDPSVSGRLDKVDSRGRTPSMEELESVHKLVYVQKLRELSSRLQQPTMVDDSTYISPGSYGSVAEGVGAVLSLVDALMNLHKNKAILPHHRMQGSSSSSSSSSSTDYPDEGMGGRDGAAAGFALVRPPGHHVLAARPMGFGLLNTVSLAARYVQAKHQMQRVLIFDFDVHHGNGTMEAFYDDPSVLYVSTHQDGLWPRTGRLTNTGNAEGKGYTINIPLPAGSGDTAMSNVFSQILWPAAERFKPDFILVSAGYDSHAADPLGQFQCTTNTYGWMSAELVQMASTLCGPGRVLFVLEGGYHLDSLGQSVVASMRGMMSLAPAANGSQANAMLQPEQMHKVEKLCEQVRQLHGL